MKTFKRICTRPFKIEDKEGNTFELEIGKEYLTSGLDMDVAAHGPQAQSGNVVVFSNYWVSVPIECFW